MSTLLDQIKALQADRPTEYSDVGVLRAFLVESHPPPSYTFNVRMRVWSVERISKGCAVQLISDDASPFDEVMKAIHALPPGAADVLFLRVAVWQGQLDDPRFAVGSIFRATNVSHLSDDYRILGATVPLRWISGAP